MRANALLLSLAALLALPACPAADDDDVPAAPSGPQLLLPADYAEGSGQVLPGLVGLPNIDDDSGSGQPDWLDDDIASWENELSEFTIPASIWEGTDEGDRFNLSLRGDVDHFRVRWGSMVVLGPSGADDAIEDWDVARSSSDFVMTVEHRTMLAEGSLVLERLDAGGQVVDFDWFYVTTAPLILNHHLQQTEHVWVTDVNEPSSFYNNIHLVETYAEVLGDQFTAPNYLAYGQDVWIQDEIQIGYLTAPSGRLDLTIDSIRDRGLDPFPENELAGTDQVVQTWGNPQFVNSMDSFGNLEVSPPVTVDGVEYPFGRIYWGGDENRFPARELTDFLASQKIQKPFNPDTGWLCVGHIDEVTSTLPDPSSDLGFKFVMADTHSAWELLESMPNTPLPRYAPDGQWGHGLADTQAMVNSNALRMENEEVQEDHLDPMLDLFRAELGLTDDDILYMPSLFEDIGCGQAAVIPGMVNLIVTNRGDQVDVFLADPFTRNSDDPRVGQEEDAFINHVEDMVPAGTDLHFVDNWAVYHIGIGEVHCGTNMIRTPEANWWEVAGHLLEDQ